MVKIAHYPPEAMLANVYVFAPHVIYCLGWRWQKRWHPTAWTVDATPPLATATP